MYYCYETTTNEKNITCRIEAGPQRRTAPYCHVDADGQKHYRYESEEKSHRIAKIRLSYAFNSERMTVLRWDAAAERHTIVAGPYCDDSLPFGGIVDVLKDVVVTELQRWVSAIDMPVTRAEVRKNRYAQTADRYIIIRDLQEGISRVVAGAFTQGQAERKLPQVVAEYPDDRYHVVIARGKVRNNY